MHSEFARLKRQFKVLEKRESYEQAKKEVDRLRIENQYIEQHRDKIQKDLQQLK